VAEHEARFPVRTSGFGCSESLTSGPNPRCAAERWEEPSEQVTRPPVMPRPKAKSELAVQPQEPAAPVAEESKRLSVVAYYVGQKVDLFAVRLRCHSRHSPAWRGHPILSLSPDGRSCRRTL
jgi:hypothetical protein